MISVCIATYNGERYVRNQIETILPQLDAKDEIIVSDDGSTDETLNIIKSFKDSRIKILEGISNCSPIKNFERALVNVHGDYVFLSDQDDKWMPNKIEMMMRYLRFYDCVVSDNIVVDGNDEIISPSFYKQNGTHVGKYYNLFIKNGYLGCCMAFDRKVLEASLPFPNDIPMHDIWIGNVAAFRFRLKFISDKLIYFCRHGDNASTSASESKYNFFRRFLFRYNTWKYLIRR